MIIISDQKKDNPKKDKKESVMGWNSVPKTQFVTKSLDSDDEDS